MEQSKQQDTVMAKIKKKIDNGEKLNEEEFEFYWNQVHKIYVCKEDWDWLEKYLSEDIRK